MSAHPLPVDPQHALLDAIFTHAPVGLGCWDAELRFQRINRALAEINGVAVEDHLGRTPADVLGPFGAEPEEQLRRVLDTGEPVTGMSHAGEMAAQPGKMRRWLASYYPVVDPGGAVSGVAAAVVEVTAQQHAEDEQVRLLKEAVTARAHAEAAQIRAEAAQARAEEAQARTEFLAEAGRRMAISMDYEVTLREVAEISVPIVADWCAITVARTGGRLERLAVAHRDGRLTARAREAMAGNPPRRTDLSGPGAVIRTGEIELITELGDDWLEGAAGGGAEQVAELRAAGLRSTLVVPLRTPDGTIGAISFAMAESGRAFGPEDVSLARALAGRAALHIRNAQLYTERSHIARTLQAGLLPRSLPAIPGVEVAARHRAAGTTNEVGGDFYDVFPTEDEVWTALIGDVTGKGPEAAAVTSLARHTLRTASLGEKSPAANLHVLNRAMLADLDSSRFCTVVYARICPGPAGALVTLASGGHPPPIVLRADGALEMVEVVGTLVGGVPDPVFAEVDVRLGPGDLLLLYTDGVTELRTTDPAYGERRLLEALRDAAGGTAEAVADAVELAAVEAQGGRPRDDIALLAIRATPAT